MTVTWVPLAKAGSNRKFHATFKAPLTITFYSASIFITLLRTTPFSLSPLLLSPRTFVSPVIFRGERSLFEENQNFSQLSFSGQFWLSAATSVKAQTCHHVCSNRAGLRGRKGTAWGRGGLGKTAAILNFTYAWSHRLRRAVPTSRNKFPGPKSRHKFVSILSFRLWYSVYSFIFCLICWGTEAV